MESIHYTLADPQMIPVDMLDVILPEDMYRLNYSYADDQDSAEEEEEDREEAGVVTTVSRLLASPYKLFVYYLELWIDGLVKRTSYEKYWIKTDETPLMWEMFQINWWSDCLFGQ